MLRFVSKTEPFRITFTHSISLSLLCVRACGFLSLAMEQTVALPAAVEELIQAICNEKSVASPVDNARRRLAVAGEAESLRILADIRQMTSELRNFTGLILYKTNPSRSSLTSPRPSATLNNGASLPPQKRPLNSPEFFASCNGPQGLSLSISLNCLMIWLVLCCFVREYKAFSFERLIVESCKLLSRIASGCN